MRPPFVRHDPTARRVIARLVVTVGVAAALAAAATTADARVTRPDPHPCRASDVRCLIRHAFGPRHARAATRVAWCESRLRPRAYNRSSGASGVFQFIPSTWRGRWNPYRRQSPFNAAANVRAARILHRLSGWRPWVCKP